MKTYRLVGLTLTASGLILSLGCASPELSQPSSIDVKAVKQPEAKPSANPNGVTGEKLPIEGGIVLKPDQAFPQISKISELPKLSSVQTICTVNDVPITLGEYRRQFNAQQQQMQAALGTDGKTLAYLVQQAAERDISLDSKEKTKLIKTAHISEGADKKKFAGLLADSKLTPKEFDKQVLEVGLAAKVGDQIIEHSLLPELVNRQLLCQAAENAGFTKQALNKYEEMKKTDEYKKMEKVTGFSEADLQDEIVKNLLAQMMIEKIVKDTPLIDKDIRNYYEAHKAELKHGPRLRMRQIVLAAPKENLPRIESLKQKVQRTTKLTGVALDQKVKEEIAKQRGKAEKLLEQAKNGGDFAKLANENTEDPSVKSLRNGGDTGWQEKSQVTEELVSVCNKLALNEVYSSLIESPYGFHIVKLTGREPAGVISFDEAKDQLKQLLAQQHDELIVKKWLAENRKQAKIVFSPQFKAAFNQPAADTKQKHNKANAG